MTCACQDSNPGVLHQHDHYFRSSFRVSQCIQVNVVLLYANPDFNSQLLEVKPISNRHQSYHWHEHALPTRPNHAVIRMVLGFERTQKM